MRARCSVLTVAYLLLACRLASAQGLTVAAASDLQSVLPAMAARFEKETGQPVRLIFGSSGNFFTQAQNGAPFDVFLSADIDYPRRLEGAGLVERGSLYEYATGHIVLWTRHDSGIDAASPFERDIRSLPRAASKTVYASLDRESIRGMGDCPPTELVVRSPNR